MDVVSPELNIILPDEIMDTGIDDVPPAQPGGTAVRSDTNDDATVPMETDTPTLREHLSLASDAPIMGHAQALTAAVTTDSTLAFSSVGQLPLSISSPQSPVFTLKPSLATSSAVTRTTDSVTGTSVSTAGLQKVSAPFSISAANHQIILNKVASSQATEAAKSSPQVIKQEGQKLLVTAIGKPPIVLQLPHTGRKSVGGQTSGDARSPTPQFKVVTFGGRTELKPVVGGVAGQMSTLQAQQMKAVQVISICTI